MQMPGGGKRAGIGFVVKVHLLDFGKVKRRETFETPEAHQQTRY